MTVIFRSIDSYPEPASLIDSTLNVSTCLELPFLQICLPDQNVPGVLDNRTILSKRASYFFCINSATGGLSFKPPAQCASPTLLKRIQARHRDRSLNFLPFFVNLLSSVESESSPNTVVNFGPYLLQLKFSEQSIFTLPNASLRRMYLRNLPPITTLAQQIPASHFKAFLRSPMLSTSRNLWYRILHDKVAAKANVAHILQLPEDRCHFCGLQESAMHLLITCPANSDIWRNFILCTSSRLPQ